MMLNEHLSLWQRLRFRLREWRRAGKSALPYVRRRVHRRLEKARDELAQAVLQGLSPAAAARVEIIKDLNGPLVGDICLFVTYAPVATLKPHVATHLSQLMDNGVAVLLVVNTDISPREMVIPSTVLRGLAACVVRENVGLDFAAWGHLYSMYGRQFQPDRLMLVNDSIVGPLDKQAFQFMLERLRRSEADVVGLTENYERRYHLQSFFLVFNARALGAVTSVLDRMVSLPNKDLVIEVYETRLTQYMVAKGLKCEALFPTSARSLHAPPNDTDLRWGALLSAGFPFVKGSVVSRLRNDPELQARVPADWRPPQDGK